MKHLAVALALLALGTATTVTTLAQAEPNPIPHTGTQSNNQRTDIRDIEGPIATRGAPRSDSEKPGLCWAFFLPLHYDIDARQDDRRGWAVHG